MRARSLFFTFDCFHTKENALYLQRKPILSSLCSKTSESIVRAMRSPHSLQTSPPRPPMILHSATRLLGAAFLALGLSTPAATLAQQVIFPQEQQAGTARLARTADHYVLSNDLLTATFVASDGKLRFGG